jgi:hypothetical protein
MPGPRSASTVLDDLVCRVCLLHGTTQVFLLLNRCACSAQSALHVYIDQLFIDCFPCLESSYALHMQSLPDLRLHLSELVTASAAISHRQPCANTTGWLHAGSRDHSLYCAARMWYLHQPQVCKCTVQLRCCRKCCALGRCGHPLRGGCLQCCTPPLVLPPF